MNIIFTVCNRTNLAHALALADSALRTQPQHIFYLGWVDPQPLKALPEHIKVLPVAEAGITAWERMEAGYFDVELLPACRPWFALALLKKHTDCRTLTFLAPTVRLFADYLSTWPQADFLLSPNITTPLAPSRILDDKRILNIGMFHAGSWALQPTEETVNTLHWWASRTADRAKFDLCEGMNLDQLWLNYVPVWIPKSLILRNAGWHFGLHNLLNRRLSQESGKWTVDGTALISVDFAGLDYFDPVWSNHAALISESPVFQSMFETDQRNLAPIDRFTTLENQPSFGKTLIVKKNRIFRNNLSAKLRKLTQYIDQF
jgi:hypothetical protein